MNGKLMIVGNIVLSTGDDGSSTKVVKDMFSVTAPLTELGMQLGQALDTHIHASVQARITAKRESAERWVKRAAWEQQEVRRLTQLDIWDGNPETKSVHIAEAEGNAKRYTAIAEKHREHADQLEAAITGWHPTPPETTECQ